MKLKEIIKKKDALIKELDQYRPISKEREMRIMQKFRLDWNYNSNHLEGNQLDFGETKALILFGITAQGKPLKDHIEMQGHDEAIKYIEEIIKQNRPLTEQFIRELHEIILHEPYQVDAVTPEGQPTKKWVHLGEYKREPNHVITRTGEMFYFASPEETPAKMQELIEWYRENIDKKDPLLVAAEFHYRFVRIHPFDDGNGRMARILMNFILMQKGFPPVIIKTEKKNEYISALQQADAGKLEVFYEYIGEQMLHSLEMMIKGAKGEEIEDPDDLDKRIALLDQKIKNLEGEEVRIKKSGAVVAEFIEKSFWPLVCLITDNLKKIEGWFYESSIRWEQDGTHPLEITNNDKPLYKEIIDLVNVAKQKNSNKIRFQVQLKGFKRSGTKAFNMYQDVSIEFNELSYTLFLGQNQKEVVDKLYHQHLTEREIDKISKEFVKEIIDRIEIRLSEI